MIELEEKTELTHQRDQKVSEIHPRGVNLHLPKRMAAITPIVSTTGMSPHADEIMGSPRVRAIYWGSAYGSQASGLTQQGQALDSFFTSICPSDYFTFPGA